MPMSMMDQPSCSRDMENLVAASGDTAEKDNASTKAREALREVQSLKEAQDRSKAARIVETMEIDLPE
ncbi:hypothetical protein GCK32_006363, partial [Trichostrongylus colubriformis]